MQTNRPSNCHSLCTSARTHARTHLQPHHHVVRHGVARRQPKQVHVVGQRALEQPRVAAVRHVALRPRGARLVLVQAPRLADQRLHRVIEAHGRAPVEQVERGRGQGATTARRGLAGTLGDRVEKDAQRNVGARVVGDWFAEAAAVVLMCRAIFMCDGSVALCSSEKM